MYVGQGAKDHMRLPRPAVCSPCSPLACAPRALPAGTSRRRPLFAGTLFLTLSRHPPLPQVVNRRVRSLEGQWLAEYGFPSTHAMSVAGQAAMIVWYTWREDYAGVGEYPLGLACVLGAILVAITSVGRMYLGVHSVTDIFGGRVRRDGLPRLCP